MPSFKNRFARFFLTLLVAGAFAFSQASALWAASPPRLPDFLRKDAVRAPERILEALDLWEPEAARAELAAIPADKISPSDAIYLEARIEFLEGNYARARELMEELSRKGLAEDAGIGHFLEFVNRTFDETKSFVSRESQHFRIYFPKGIEEIIVEPALDTLEGQYKALSKILGIEIPGKIRVEVAPTGRAFIALSDIPKEAVETTNTIALCKYNRLIITSPRALPRGYVWRDTLAHELTHYFVYKRSRNGTPVWLHEGIAKYFETAWRTDNHGELNPSEETLLYEALQGNKIIPFERMHPSFAFLKSPEEGSQAFAQVSTVIEYLHRHLDGGNYTLLNKIEDELANGAEYEEAITAARGKPFKEFYDGWVSWLRQRPLRVLRNKHIEQVKFVESPEAAEKAEEETIDSEKAKKHLRVGDLLRDRGRMLASAEEYEKAHEAAGLNPIILNKLAFSYLRSERFEAAKKYIDLCVENFPEYGSIYKRMGEFYSAKKDWPKAAEGFERALDVNPFDAEIHEMLVAVYGGLGDGTSAKKHEKVLEILSGRPGSPVP
ncbi:MAG: hypothetical protein AB1405_17575 [Bdellovibrionota bacterium]